MDKLDEALKNMSQLKSSIEDTAKKMAEAANNLKKQEVANETKFVSGMMLSLMNDGSVRIQFDTPLSGKKFFDEYK